MKNQNYENLFNKKKWNSSKGKDSFKIIIIKVHRIYLQRLKSQMLIRIKLLIQIQTISFMNEY
jgi:hypothetical protein